MAFPRKGKRDGMRADWEETTKGRGIQEQSPRGRRKNDYWHFVGTGGLRGKKHLQIMRR